MYYHLLIQLKLTRKNLSSFYIAKHLRHDMVAVDSEGKFPLIFKFFWREHPDEAFRKLINSIKVSEVSGQIGNIGLTQGFNMPSRPFSNSNLY